MKNMNKKETGFESIEEAFKHKKASLLAHKGLDYYFDSYSKVGIHYEMLSDKHRTESYRDSIINNPHLFKDKVVMDIGCGTGILSMFAASAGAKKVYAIEMASIVNFAREIVKENGFEKVIEFHHGKLEDLVLPFDKVDIIISEWMGYLLLFEGMLDSVLVARDKYLAKDGLLFPNKELIYVNGFEDYEALDRTESYRGFNGINYDEFIEVNYTVPDVNCIKPNDIMTEDKFIYELDLQTVSIPELDFACDFTLRCTKKGYVHGLCLWFDSLFTHGKETVNLTTSPHAKPTHWKQGLLYLRNPLPVFDGDNVYVKLALKKSKDNPRNLDIRVDYSLKNELCCIKETQFYLFK